jgi:hypothetical protein
LPGTIDPVSTRLRAKGAPIMTILSEKYYIGIDVSKAILEHLYFASKNANAN